MADEQKINLNIVDGDSFYAHETSINFNPTQFVLDFKNVSPRIDARSQEGPTVTLRHNVILLDPFHTKQVYALLGQALTKFEADFGKIEQPKALKEFEKKYKKSMEKGKGSAGKSQGPTYFG